ncbi:helix-turn-helix domain-containing protein [Paenibacillus roseipurpureus]|uniref:Helix-turn-helix domain-containing protein n=1 Tax=Paenibacillus roseopurpureus TaxID=2918901 RepID=A0AA96LL93_9BACL|nr:helix-turn-helix domain-containing protein [Paenibacillus sp. MBLB1832]WNR43034.1 helix-turn-helix domain-containing protein [Paenibacillus sp. MBLB1832]
MKRIFYQRRSVALTWLISYLTVLLLPILCSIFVYLISNRTLETQIETANQSLLSQVQEVSDNYFNAMERLNLELTWNVNMQNLLNSSNYEIHPEEFNVDAYFISKEMENYKTAYSFVDQFYSYLKDYNKVIAPSRIYDGKYAYEIYYSDKMPFFEQWFETVNMNNLRSFMPMVRRDENGKMQKTVAYVSSFTFGNTNSPATNVIMMDQKHVLGAISNVELFSKGHVLILNDQNEIIVSNSNTNEDVVGVLDIPKKSLNATSSVAFFELEGIRYQVLYMKSQRSGLMYVSMVPSNLYWEKAKLVRNFIIASCTVSLLFFVRRNYNPINRLVQTLSGRAESGYGAWVNEFQYIQQAFDQSQTKMDSMELQMERQNQMLRNHFLVRLLKGRLDGNVPVEESMAAFQIRISTQNFAVILIYVENVEEFYDKYEKIDSVRKHMLLNFIITNVFEEIAAQFNDGYVLEIDDGLALLINFRETSAKEQASELERIARDAQRFLAEKYAIHLTLSISRVHNQLESIPQAYQDAMDAMEYKLVMGSKEILLYESVHQEPNQLGYNYPLQIEQQLINFLKLGEFEKAKETLDEIIQNNFELSVVSVDLARCLILNLASTMIKAVSETGSLSESFLVRNPKQIKQLMACETIHEIREEMTLFMKEVCDHNAVLRQRQLQANRQKAMDGRIGLVNDFILANYNDPNLNISLIGQHFDMKPTYLSKLFKDHTGEGLLEFINKTRIDNAKKLIYETDKNMSDVAGSVGFNDVTVFIRTFKKYEGITPGKYKEMASELEK